VVDLSLPSNDWFMNACNSASTPSYIFIVLFETEQGLSLREVRCNKDGGRLSIVMWTKIIIVT
jgi:hypothetical protein